MCTYIHVQYMYTFTYMYAVYLMLHVCSPIPIAQLEFGEVVLTVNQYQHTSLLFGL